MCGSLVGGQMERPEVFLWTAVSYSRKCIMMQDIMVPISNDAGLLMQKDLGSTVAPECFDTWLEPEY